MAKRIHQSHRFGEGEPATDRRVQELNDQNSSYSLLNRAVQDLMIDPYRSLLLDQQHLAKTNPLQQGVVVYAMPYVNWYRVQLGPEGGTIGCCQLGDGGTSGLGPRPITSIAPDTQVLVFIPPNYDWGVILGTIPPIQRRPEHNPSDRIVQGGGTGFQREDAYLAPFEKANLGGGITDFSAGRPMDETGMEWGHLTETGSGVIIDPFLVMLRINEICGLFLNYFDDHMRLAGYNLDFESACHHLHVRNDEGECQLREGEIIYPWEGLGLYSPEECLGREYTPEEVQYDTDRAGLDLAEGEEQIQPVYRYCEYGGYLGQGRLRQVMVPARQTGKRLHSDDPRDEPDTGVFEESIGLDGSYHLRSARRITLAKHVLIPVPKRRRGEEDQSEGDTLNNYRPSGQFGESGPSHQIGGQVPLESIGQPVDLPSDQQVDERQQRLVGFHDVLTQMFNWDNLHAFHYHQQDYTVPNESDLVENGPFDRAQDHLDFTRLRDQADMDHPAAKRVNVDHRHGEVSYYQRTADFSFTDDGGVLIEDGYGSQIEMTGGHIRLRCPGDVQLMPGRNLVGLGGHDVVLRARESLDATAGNKDLRLKAECNLQALAGNCGEGGMLFESKGTTRTHDYEDKVGEEVISAGISFKAPESDVNLWGSNVYLRTGGDDALNSGDIVLDAAKGRRRVAFKGSQVEAYADNSFGVYLGPSGDGGAVSTAHVFTDTGVRFAESLSVDGPSVIGGGVSIGGNVAIDGEVGNTSESPFIGQIQGNSLGQLRDAIATVAQNVVDTIQTGQEAHGQIFLRGLYRSGRSGNDRTIDQAGFSYRDVEEGAQYDTRQFQLPEARWQMLLRLGGASGGRAWEEPTVRYQGRDQLPWPGYDNWTQRSSLVQAEQLELLDVEQGIAVDRGEANENATLPDTEVEVLERGYTVN